eukprot:187497-Hanusia_phi.AAC.2
MNLLQVSARADGQFDGASNRISSAAVNHDFVLDAGMLPDPRCWVEEARGSSDGRSSKGVQEQFLCWRGPLAVRRMDTRRLLRTSRRRRGRRSMSWPL